MFRFMGEMFDFFTRTLKVFLVGFKIFMSNRLQAQAATLDDEGLQFLGVVGRRFHSLNAWESKGRTPRNSRAL